MGSLTVRRLRENDANLAIATLSVIAHVFDDPFHCPMQSYIGQLLSRGDYWLLAALIDDEAVGGLTAFSLPLPRTQSTELFIYDIAVHPKHQRLGIGRRLVEAIRRLAAEDGIATTWVVAENEDDHAFEFYKSIGGTPNPVTVYTF